MTGITVDNDPHCACAQQPERGINMSTITDLTLYHFETCPFCAATRRVIDDLGLEIERRDILLNPTYRNELVSGGGKPQVPSLRIETEDGAIQWLYESADIVRFVRDHAHNTTSQKAAAA
jgi:glutaredoxin